MRFLPFYLRAVNADSLLAACDMLELNVSVNKSEQSVVLAYSNVVSSVDCCSSLSEDDVALP